VGGPARSRARARRGFSAALGESGSRVVVGILVAQAAVLGALDVLLVVVTFGLLGIRDGGMGLVGAACVSDGSAW